MQKYQYIDSGIEWLGIVPAHWKVDRIKDKTTCVVGGDWGNDTDSEADGKDIVVLRVADLDDIYFKFEDLTFRKIKDGSFKTRKVSNRCLVIEKSGGGEKQLVGRVGFPLGIDFDAICSNFMAKIEFDNTIDLKFANYLFSALYGSSMNFPFVQQTTGIQNLNINYYLTTNAVFPPLLEQKVIADYLELACNRIDHIIAIKEEQLAKIEAYFLQRLHEIIRYGIDNDILEDVDWLWTKKIPNKWKKKRFKDYFRLSRGVDLPKDKMIEGSYPVFGSNGIIGYHNQFTTPGPGITVGRSGSVGAINYVMEDYWAHNTCLYIYQNNGNNWKYLYYFLMGIDLSSLSGGSVVGTLNRNYIHKEHIAMPDLITQNKMVSLIDDLKLKTDNLLDKINSQIKTLKAFRKSLIHECVTGKKQVVDSFSSNKKFGINA